MITTNALWTLQPKNWRWFCQVWVLLFDANSLLQQKKSNKKLNAKRNSQIKAGKWAIELNSLAKSAEQSPVMATNQTPAKASARSVSSGKRKSSTGDDISGEDEETPVKRPRKKAPAKSRATPKAETAENGTTKTPTAMSATFNSPNSFGTVSQAQMTYQTFPIPTQTLMSNAPLLNPIPSYGQNPYLSGTFSPSVPSVGVVNPSTYDGHKFKRPPPRKDSYNATHPTVRTQQEQFGQLEREEANLIYLQQFNHSHAYPDESYFP